MNITIWCWWWYPFSQNGSIKSAAQGVYGSDGDVLKRALRRSLDKSWCCLMNHLFTRDIIPTLLWQCCNQYMNSNETWLMPFFKCKNNYSCWHHYLSVCYSTIVHSAVSLKGLLLGNANPVLVGILYRVFWSGGSYGGKCFL